ncbi:aromatic ring-hydroxylating dioxygenase subunit alpha [Rhodococcus ruber]|uniref:Aromatic ring-hydroxylating dioxygenase subunit alpha n=1 Tax=Rhodococcus ruber TaxID=1830 RepID=A0ABT4MFR2_9NOCA|nr:aromatic ring-hydroxylating dioxygenase subunit alpha [Rhodococcus ruber]MCZ4518870.1 aromatic ring-hydroxylating dioxygenase subunit alpha [Rhodococcus ruber]
MSEYVLDDREMPQFKVNRETMIDTAVLMQEQKNVFDKSWLYVGHESELAKPHSFKTRKLAGRPIIFARDGKGEIRVWLNSCPHRGAMICREPEGNARFMTCFYHGWTFNIAGEQVSMPGDQSYGENFERPGLAKPPRLSSYRGFVFASFDPDIVDLETYLAGAREYIDLIADQSELGMQVIEGTHEYSVKANWKLLVENSIDGYHALSTHQRYFEMVSASRDGLDLSLVGKERGIALGNGHAVVASPPGSEELLGRPLSPEGHAERAARYAAIAEKHGDDWATRLRGQRNLVIFPNLIIIDLVMGVVIRKIDPITPDYMEVSAWHIVPPEEGPDLLAQRLDNFLTFWGPGGLASPDDVEALESAQRGFATYKELGWSDISRGMSSSVVSGQDELQMRTWWRRWNELVTGEVLPPEEKDPLGLPFNGKRLELSPADDAATADVG